TFTTAAFGRSSFRQFEASSHKAAPKGLPSSFVQHRASRRVLDTTRSSNRTCPIKASGFPTGFTARLTNEDSIGHLEASGLRAPKHHFIAEGAGGPPCHPQPRARP